MTANSESTDRLGRRLKQWRQRHGLRISDVGARTGLAVSTISKVENGAMSLTYDKLLQLAKGLSIDISELFNDETHVDGPQRMVTARRSVSKPTEEHYVRAGLYEYWYLNTDLSKKIMTPMMGRTHAQTIEEFGPLIRHPGEEFLLVIEGVVVVHTEFYTPVVLHAGESLYIDSNMGHAYLTQTGQVGRFVVVCVGDTHDDAIASAKRNGTGAPPPVSIAGDAAVHTETPRHAAQPRKAKPASRARKKA